MTTPLLFSILLTTFNRSQFLPRAINSVLKQTFSDFELIIIDDHSTDNTQQVVGEFSDPRITYIRHDNNQGVSSARNTGIKHAKGEYLCFLDDDDEYLPDFLEAINAFLKKSNQPFIGFIRVGIAEVHAPNTVGNEKEIIKNRLWHLEQEKNLLFLREIYYVGAIYHNICFKRAGLFNTTLSFLEDLDMLIRILESGGSYASIPRILIKYYIHNKPSLSRMHLSNKIANLENFIYLQDKFLSQYPVFWLTFYNRLASAYYRIGETKKARTLVRSILKKRYYHLKTWDLFRRFECRLLKYRLKKLFTALEKPDLLFF